MKRRHRQRGFTILELLVVVGIVAVLIGLLLPSLSRAREAAKSTQCISNLRQMAIAAAAYVTDNDGRYPPAYGTGYRGTTSYYYSWDFTTIRTPGNPDQVVPGLLWQGQGIDRIHQCPSFEGASNSMSDPYTGYNYNTSYIGHGQGESIPAPARVFEVRNPSETALFGDGEWSSGANKFMRAPFPNPGDQTFSARWSGTQGFRHHGATNVSFCDGHAESLAPPFTDNADGAGKVAKGTGFLSKDNSLYDLQ